ncbi:aminotransferase family protein [Crossiella cryophila]|uniref:Adenosylmethionine-8-amino-7-oxononanoate aminotransferase n=1 Tax=Crossiella cryophila TaxID=43355 RepID=A0A7W7CCE9_9PSEU|nr:aminotransferase class III-fold pyridoxal phosphate-dependent enzyme [Crossiella cryophila]MBB4678452.1 adenosylmethionine-8-amino-7-oxononanoate aminotransferase [Crossiella cryophila]
MSEASSEVAEVPVPSIPADPVWNPMSDYSFMAEHGVRIVSGSGVRVRDDQGNEYLSGTAGLWNVTCGFGHPDILDAITSQLRKLSYGTLFLFSHEPATTLARRLLSIAPPGLTRVHFTTGGASAVETAMKVVRRYFRLTGEPERRLIVSLDRYSWHGTLYGSMSVTGEDIEQRAYGADLSGVRKIPTPRIADDPPGATALTAFAQLVDAERGRIAAVILEPVLASGGVIPLPPEFVAGVSELCRDNGILLIADEVATGFGRTGRMFGGEHYDLRPDVVVLSKGINSGYLPLGAALFTEAIFDAFRRAGLPLLHGETQGGNPAACAAAIATLDVLDREGLVENSRVVGEYLLDRLAPLRSRATVRDVRGRGLMIGIELSPRGGKGPASILEVMTAVIGCRYRGLLVHPLLASGGIGLFPPLTLSLAEADQVAEVLDQVTAAG